MASSGSGLPIARSDRPLVQPGGVPNIVNAAAYSAAEDWNTIAAAGSKVMDIAQREMHQAQVAYLADQDVEIARQRAELRDRHADDPAGFDTAWKAYTDGKLGSADPGAVPHLRKVLGTEGNSAYTAILTERRAKDERLHAQSIQALIDQTGGDVVTSALAGTFASEEGQIKAAKLRGVLDTAVTSGLMAKERADQIFDDKMSAAHGEIAAREGVQVYREKGFDAAVHHLRSNILENETLSFKGEGRYKSYDRGLTAIKLAQAADKQDRYAIEKVSTDFRARIDANQPFDPQEARDIQLELQRTGAAAEHKRLTIALAVSQATAPYRLGVNLPQFSEAVTRIRLATSAPRAYDARDFLISKGWSPAAAAGIVGNLLQESATLNPAQSHDAGTGIGIAGWRLERRTALQSFAKTRGTSETDFQTQLEFIDHELRGSESSVGARLMNAKTAAEAAEAFIHFERPQGYTPDNPRAGHGFANRLRNAQAMANDSGIPVELSGQYGAATARRIQEIYVAQARKAWPDFKARIEQGKVLNEEDLFSVYQAATLSGDGVWVQEVERLGRASLVGADVSKLPTNMQQAAVDIARKEFDAVTIETIEKQIARQRKMVADDPVGFAVERGQAAPAPFELSNAAAARAAVAQRVRIAGGIAEEQGTAPGNPFRPAETAAMAGAIAGPDTKAAAIAVDAILALPDVWRVPALAAPSIRDAIAAGARSSSAAKFSSAMKLIDAIWAQSPGAARELFGEDQIHALMTWQSTSRYHLPAEFEEERRRQNADPQERARRKLNEDTGRELARKISFDQVVKQFDTSSPVTPAFIARNVTGSMPNAPVDAITRDMLMGDFETLFARRYADTGDESIALKQTVKMLETKWKRSEVNGGRLMLNAPEHLYSSDGRPVYPAVDGSHDWMTKQIEKDIAAAVGKPKNDAILTSQQNWSYTLVSDRRTQSEAQAGQPASYLVVVRDAKTERDTVLPRRFAFDPTEAVAKGRADFAAQRARALAPYQSITGEIKGIYAGPGTGDR